MSLCNNSRRYIATLPISAPNTKKNVLLECIDESISNDHFPMQKLLAWTSLKQQ